MIAFNFVNESVHLGGNDSFEKSRLILYIRKVSVSDSDLVEKYMYISVSGMFDSVPVCDLCWLYKPQVLVTIY